MWTVKDLLLQLSRGMYEVFIVAHVINSLRLIPYNSSAQVIELDYKASVELTSARSDSVSPKLVIPVPESN